MQQEKADHYESLVSRIGRLIPWGPLWIYHTKNLYTIRMKANQIPLVQTCVRLILALYVGSYTHLNFTFLNAHLVICEGKGVNKRSVQEV